MTFDQMVRTAAAASASDIHLRAGHAPLVRINGSLQRWASVAARQRGATSKPSRCGSCRRQHQERLQTHLEVDVAWQAPGVGRCRASVFRQRGTIAVSMRLIPDKIPLARGAGPAAVGRSRWRRNRAASCS